MRVDDVPPGVRLPLLLYGHAMAVVLRSLLRLTRLTLRVRVEGAEHLTSATNCIFCHWHEAVSLFFQANVPRLLPVLSGAPHAWMQHPLWHMKPIHLFLRAIGVREIVLGSTGHDGRSAAEALVALLRAGHSTVVLPDGPGGPPHVLKKGVLHMAAQSGVPIVPLRLRGSRTVRLPTWDRKLWALPFSTIRVSIGAPIVVTDTTLEAAGRRLIDALG